MQKVLFFDYLEDKKLLNTFAVMSPQYAAAMVSGDDDLPPPEPEPDPGDLPTDDDPIIYPPLPPSGPVGPG